MTNFIILNQILCKSCNDILISRYIHDFECCSCGKVCIDGGYSYLRRLGAEYEEQSVHSTEPFELIRKSLYRGSRGKDGISELKYICLYQMSNNYLFSLIEYLNKFPKESKFLTFYKIEQQYRKDNNIFIAD